MLVRARNPLNIGAAARAMANFGVSALRLVNPYSVAFREARSAVGASDLLKRAGEYQTLAEAVADCTLVVGTTAVRNRALQHPLHRLGDDSAREIRQHCKSGRVAILFGSEKIGLTNQDFSHCHWLLHIPMHAEHVSMNLGQAVAVCLYEVGRDSSPHPDAHDGDRATAAANQQVSESLLEALQLSEYVKPGSEAACERKTRRMVLRFNLASEDATVFLGMVRQIVWRLRQGRKD